MLQVSERAQMVIESPIRKFLPFMNAAEKDGVKVFKLNIGDSDLEMPTQFMHAVRDYQSAMLPYAPSPGIEVHSTAWQNYYKQFGVNLKPNHIIPTVGCTEAMMFAFMAVADYGDEIIVFEPLYVNYRPLAQMLGIRLVPVTLPIENDFVLADTDAIRQKITPRTKAVLLVNPDNPTGKVWQDFELRSILKLVKQRGLFLIVDETYREIRFDGKSPMSMLGCAYAKDNILVLDSVSKRFRLPGARIGCLASFNEDVMRSALKFAQVRLSAGTLEQLGTVPLLNDSQTHVNPVVQEFWDRRDVVARVLGRIPGAVFKPAQGAFYQAVKLPVDDAENFARFMISEFRDNGQTVMVTPMKDFYITEGLGESEIRIAFVLGVSELGTAMGLLERGIEAYNEQSKAMAAD